MSKTLYDKIWDSHIVHEETGKPALLYIDLHLIHEVTTPQAFAGLRLANRKVRRPDLTFGTLDHAIPTINRDLPFNDKIAEKQVEALRKNCEEFGVRLFDLDRIEQGIIHVFGPEQGLVQPGQTIVFYMGLLGLSAICRELVSHGLPAATPVALVQQGTTPQHRVLTGTLETLPGIVQREDIKPPTLIIVGEVVKLRDKLKWFVPVPR